MYQDAAFPFVMRVCARFGRDGSLFVSLCEVQLTQNNWPTSVLVLLCFHGIDPKLAASTAYVLHQR